MSDGRRIALSVDPNTSDDVCTFCKHAIFGEGFMGSPVCTLGHTPYFHSVSNMGAIWVSDCEAGELRPSLAALDRNKQ